MRVGRETHEGAGVDGALDLASVAVAKPGTTPRGGNPGGTEPVTEAGPGPKRRHDDALLQALADLDALTMPCPGRPDLRIPGAGAPWFLTLFGRDSLITSSLARRARPRLAVDTLPALAATQGRRDDARSLEQPGRIVHEVRVGELSALGLVPFGRYYGSVDATALYLMLLCEVAAEEPDVAAEFEESARAAYRWMVDDGGLDDDGLLTFRPDPHGLINQGWKDSVDSSRTRDGRLATGAVAPVEVQGYAWRALRGVAGLADQWGDPGLAAESRARADALARRLADDLWSSETDFPVLALAGDEVLDPVASNAGHLLWTGALDPARARRVTDRLMEPDLWTGWGLRTLSLDARGASPASYHNGSVWPFDTALAMVGMARYGHTEEASALATGLLDAAAAFGGRLPELFAGWSRSEVGLPVPYEHASSPQAWSCAAVVAAHDLLYER